MKAIYFGTLTIFDMSSKVSECVTCQSSPSNPCMYSQMLVMLVPVHWWLDGGTMGAPYAHMVLI